MQFKLNNRALLSLFFVFLTLVILSTMIVFPNRALAAGKFTIDAKINLKNLNNPQKLKVVAFSNGENKTGSIDFMSAIAKAIASQIKTSLSDASSVAEKSIGNNSHAVAAHVSDENGYLVYVVVIVDSNGKVHKLIIDPVDNKILLSRELSGFEALMMLHQGMGVGGQNYSMMARG